MRSHATEDTALMIDLYAPPTQPGSVDPAALRRAMKYGQKARLQYGARTFFDVEAELQAEWQLRGEATEWDWVRAAVRVGYEQEASDM